MGTATQMITCMHLSNPISYVDRGFQMIETSREVGNGLVRPSSRRRRTTDIGDRDPTIAFRYLLREPRHVRRLRRTLHIIAGIVALSAIAYMLYGCT